MTKLLFLFLFLFLSATLTQAQSDSVVVVPLWMGREIDRDLRLKDHLDTLTRILDQKNGMLRRQVATKDSVIEFNKIEARAIAGLCLSAEDSIRGLYVGEKKRRRVNGLWRNVFMFTTFFAMWIAIKP